MATPNDALRLILQGFQAYEHVTALRAWLRDGGVVRVSAAGCCLEWEHLEGRTVVAHQRGIEALPEGETVYDPSAAYETSFDSWDSLECMYRTA